MYRALNASFTLSDSAFAEVRFGDPYPHLEGRRLGPYYIEATVKRSGEKIQVVLCTRPTFLDRHGRVLTGYKQEQAASVTERLTAVMLRTSMETKPAQCP